MRYVELRRELVSTCLALQRSVFQSATSGNVSTRVSAGFLITPTGIPYQDLRPSDIVEMSFAGDTIDSIRLPSSEWRFHRDLYAARPEFSGIVHAHPTYCTALACQGLEIPAFHYMVAAAGGDNIRCAGYATFGTQALSDSIAVAMVDRRACLLAHHGMLAAADTLTASAKLAVEVESLAAQYWHVLQLGEPVILSAHEMARVLEQFSTYGQQLEPDLNDRAVTAGVARASHRR